MSSPSQTERISWRWTRHVAPRASDSAKQPPDSPACREAVQNDFIPTGLCTACAAGLPPDVGVLLHRAEDRSHDVQTTHDIDMIPSSVPELETVLLCFPVREHRMQEWQRTDSRPGREQPPLTGRESGPGPMPLQHRRWCPFCFWVPENHLGAPFRIKLTPGI